MVKVYLACTADPNKSQFSRSDFERMKRFAIQDRRGIHVVVDQPEDADILVFVGSSEPDYLDIRSSPLYQRYWQRSVVFDGRDRPIPIVPGAYVSLEHTRLGHRAGAVSSFYLRVTENESLDIDTCIEDADFLFSFVGNARNHPVRSAICKIEDPRAHIRDSSGDVHQQADGISGNNLERGIYFKEIMCRSKFVLCPRGIGTSSWRLFETLRAGRVPVIISDQWVRPRDIQWDACSLWIPERQVRDLSNILRAEEHRASELSMTAREEWDRCFSEQTAFHTVIEQALSAHQAFQHETWRDQFATWSKFLEPFHMRHTLVGPFLRRLHQRVSIRRAWD